MTFSLFSQLLEAKYDYPEHAKGQGDPYLANAGRKRELRKEFRKKQKAKAHKALKRGIELNPDEVIGIINFQMQPGHEDREPWEPIFETIGQGSDVNPRKAAKEYVHILETQREWQRDLKGMAKFAKLNPWRKWTDNDIESSPYFDPWVGDLPRQKKEFQNFKKHMTAFIQEVKKLL